MVFYTVAAGDNVNPFERSMFYYFVKSFGTLEIIGYAGMTVKRYSPVNGRIGKIAVYNNGFSVSLRKTDRKIYRNRSFAFARYRRLNLINLSAGADMVVNERVGNPCKVVPDESVGVFTLFFIDFFVGGNAQRFYARNSLEL